MIDVEAAARFQIRKAERRIAEREQRRAELLDRAVEAARVLRHELGAQHVWLFGSLLRGWFHEGSDIDLAVAGIEPERFGEAVDRVTTLVGTSVDLVRMEEADARLRQRILDTGRPIP